MSNDLIVLIALLKEIPVKEAFKQVKDAENEIDSLKIDTVQGNPTKPLLFQDNKNNTTALQAPENFTSSKSEKNVTCRETPQKTESGILRKQPEQNAKFVPFEDCTPSNNAITSQPTLQASAPKPTETVNSEALIAKSTTQGCKSVQKLYPLDEMKTTPVGLMGANAGVPPVVGSQNAPTCKSLADKTLQELPASFTEGAKAAMAESKQILASLEEVLTVPEAFICNRCECNTHELTLQRNNEKDQMVKFVCLSCGLTEFQSVSAKELKKIRASFKDKNPNINTGKSDALNSKVVTNSIQNQPACNNSDSKKVSLPRPSQTLPPSVTAQSTVSASNQTTGAVTTPPQSVAPALKPVNPATSQVTIPTVNTTSTHSAPVAPVTVKPTLKKTKKGVETIPFEPTKPLQTTHKVTAEQIAALTRTVNDNGMKTQTARDMFRNHLNQKDDMKLRAEYEKAARCEHTNENRDTMIDVILTVLVPGSNAASTTGAAPAQVPSESA